jgi:regulator of CtrA degradation
MFQRLPLRLRELALHSLRLQARIGHLDQLIYAGPEIAAAQPAAVASPVQEQLARLRDAFTP